VGAKEQSGRTWSSSLWTRWTVAQVVLVTQAILVKQVILVTPGILVTQVI
jgi:hypothetical protein